MADSMLELREDLIRFQNLLIQGDLLSYSREEKESFLDNSQKLLKRLDAAGESTLTVGLLGGTGVGKSSLMNALAGLPIASTSHRRPHTDRVLIYKHAAAILPSSFGWAAREESPKDTAHRSELYREVPEANTLWMEITHHADGIRQILLCDLPDFDSLVGEHRQRVLGFLEHLDVIVWVVSPEKYADARFHAFLRQVPKSRQNFYFVLNKVDLLFEGRTMEQGYGELGKVIARFAEHLRESEITLPIIYAVSATVSMESSDPASWNQLAHFRHQIFQLRDAKEVTAIKAANLDVEVRQFLFVVEREMLHLKALQSALRDLVRELEDERGEWVAAGEEALSLWLDRYFRKEAYELLADPSQLVGPGHIVAQAAQAFRTWSKPGQAIQADNVLCFHQGTGFLLQTQAERLENRIARRMLQRGFAVTVAWPLEDLWNAKTAWEGFVRRAQEFVALRAAEHRSAAPSSYRLLQIAIYTAVFLFLIAAVAGESPWQDFFRSPGLGAFFDLVARMVLAFFSPKGFAALGSYMVLQVLLGFRFYSRYKKSLQQRTQRFIESLKLGLGRLWQEELQSVIQQLLHHEGELEKQSAQLSSLYKVRRED